MEPGACRTYFSYVRGSPSGCSVGNKSNRLLEKLPAWQVHCRAGSQHMICQCSSPLGIVKLGSRPARKGDGAVTRTPSTDCRSRSCAPLSFITCPKICNDTSAASSPLTSMQALQRSQRRPTPSKARSRNAKKSARPDAGAAALVTFARRTSRESAETHGAYRSTPKPAATQASMPPCKGRTLWKPRCIRSFATRAAETSLGHEQ